MPKIEIYPIPNNPLLEGKISKSGKAKYRYHSKATLLPWFEIKGNFVCRRAYDNITREDEYAANENSDYKVGVYLKTDDGREIKIPWARPFCDSAVLSTALKEANQTITRRDIDRMLRNSLSSEEFARYICSNIFDIREGGFYERDEEYWVLKQCKDTILSDQDYIYEWIVNDYQYIKEAENLKFFLKEVLYEDRFSYDTQTYGDTLSSMEAQVNSLEDTITNKIWDFLENQTILCDKLKPYYKRGCDGDDREGWCNIYENLCLGKEIGLVRGGD